MGKAIELFSLGKIFPSDFLKPDEQPRCEPVELKLVMEDNGLVHLENTAPKEAMWGERYWYSSSVSGTMKEQLKDVVYSIMDVIELKKGDVWVDIAGNSGYMLSQVPDSIIRISIDPVGGEIKKEAERNCDLVIQDYFSAEVFKKSKYGSKKAAVVSIISMFYDISHPLEFLHEVNEIMEDDALLVIQMSYTPLMLEQLEFSNICHEHAFYYSLFNIKPILESCGFKIMDVELNNTNAGSFRIYAMKANGDEKKFSSQTHRDVCKFRIESLLAYEATLKLDEPETWINFYDRINALRKQTIDFLIEEKTKGKVIYGYGASTKGNTLLNYFGINSSLITAIADKNKDKHGLKTVGTDIPIVSEDSMRKAQPDYLFILPFHFISEFVEREKEYLSKGGEMVVPLPTFQIISA